MTVDPPPLTGGAELAVRVYNLVSNQLREYRSREQQKKVGDDGKEAWETTTRTTRVLDLTPVLLLAATARLPDPLRLLENIQALALGLSGEEVRVALPAWILEREQEDPQWLARAMRAAGVLEGLPPMEPPDVPSDEDEDPEAREGDSSPA